MNSPNGQRGIKSWVKRHPRLSQAQKSLLEKHRKTFHFLPEDKEYFLHHLESLSSRYHSMILDIGFGLGHSLLHHAREHPGHLVIGADPHPNGSSSVLRAIERENLSNILLYQGDCLDLLKEKTLEKKINCFCIFFPDPWRKKRHHKRRLIQKEFLDLLSPALKDHGTIYIATDWQDYAQHIEQVSLEHSLYQLSFLKEKDFPYTRSETKYEQRGLNLGHCIKEFFLTKKL